MVDQWALGVDGRANLHPIAMGIELTIEKDKRNPILKSIIVILLRHCLFRNSQTDRSV